MASGVSLGSAAPSGDDAGASLLASPEKHRESASMYGSLAGGAASSKSTKRNIKDAVVTRPLLSGQALDPTKALEAAATTAKRLLSSIRDRREDIVGSLGSFARRNNAAYLKDASYHKDVVVAALERSLDYELRSIYRVYEEADEEDSCCFMLRESAMGRHRTNCRRAVRGLLSVVRLTAQRYRRLETDRAMDVSPMSKLLTESAEELDEIVQKMPPAAEDGCCLGCCPS